MVTSTSVFLEHPQPEAVVVLVAKQHLHRVRPGSAYRYYFRSVTVGDGARHRKAPLPMDQELAGVPAGEWTGRGAPLLGLSGEVTEAEMEALFGQGLLPHPELLAPGVPAGEIPAVRLGRKFIRPTYFDGEDQEPEAVVPDDDGKVPSGRRRKMKRGPVAVASPGRCSA